MRDRYGVQAVVMSGSNFVTAINCMDGRVQIPVIEWMKNTWGADYVDMITEAGPIGIMARAGEGNAVESIKERVLVSVEKHGSGIVAVVGHHDCAGNPVDRDTQIGQIRASVERVTAWGLGVQVIGLYVNEEWNVERVT